MNENEKKIEEMTFEEAMVQMEKTVRRLEEGDVPLEEAIGLFQDGMQLSKICHQKLKKVEEKMDQILEEDGQTSVFHIQEDGSS
jgi:exodeoxyribonuclease VII small subunit